MLFRSTHHVVKPDVWKSTSMRRGRNSDLYAHVSACRFAGASGGAWLGDIVNANSTGSHAFNRSQQQAASIACICWVEICHALAAATERCISGQSTMMQACSEDEASFPALLAAQADIVHAILNNGQCIHLLPFWVQNESRRKLYA